MKTNTSKRFQDSDRIIDDPYLISEVLKDKNFCVPQIEPYILALQNRSGAQFPNILRLTRSSPVFQKGPQHLATRRAIAPFFTSKAVEVWASTIDTAVGKAISNLQSVKGPNLVGDFCEPLFINVFSKIIGIETNDLGRLNTLIQSIGRLTQPMLSLKKLKDIERHLEEIVSYIPHTPPSNSASLLSVLRSTDEETNVSSDQRDVAIWLIVAGYTASQTMGFFLHDILLRDQKMWLDIASDGMPETMLEDLMARVPSTRILTRFADTSAQVSGCPFHKGDIAVLDILSANAKQKRGPSESKRHLSFGIGVHKCPGAEISRLFLRRSIPILARALPDITLHRGEVQFEIQEMVQYPTNLPVTLTAESQRENARLIEIRSLAQARKIVNDDKNWGPPQLETHLQVLSDRSGRDMSTALQIARNAMFFMSGDRHAEIRRAMAQCMGGNRIDIWDDLVAQQVTVALDNLTDEQAPDLIGHFADPVFRGIMQPALGVRPSDPAQFDHLAPILQDVLEPWLPMRELTRLQVTFDEILDLMQPPEPRETAGASILSRLLSADLPSYSDADIKALVLVLYGASFNLSHTIGNILQHLLSLKPEERSKASSPAWIDQNIETLISICASPKYIYRIAKTDQTLGQFRVSKGETLRLQLPILNRGQGVGNLAFGHGLHRCIGAAFTKKILRVAIPAFFQRFPNAVLLSKGAIALPLSQTVALSSLLANLDP